VISTISTTYARQHQKAWKMMYLCAWQSLSKTGGVRGSPWQRRTKWNDQLHARDRGSWITVGLSLREAPWSRFAAGLPSRLGRISHRPPNNPHRGLVELLQRTRLAPNARDMKIGRLLPQRCSPALREPITLKCAQPNQQRREPNSLHQQPLRTRPFHVPSQAAWYSRARENF